MIVHCWPSLLPGGGAGVDIFFVISGFLITSILMSEHAASGTISIRDFYIRRVLRIAPALLAVSIAAAVFLTLFALGTGKLSDLNKLANVVFTLTSTMNWARAFDFTSGGVLGHTWSLSVEEQFYLIWPLLLLFLLSGGVTVRQIFAGLVGAIVLVMLWRAVLGLAGAGYERIANGTDTRADGLLIGCAIAMMSNAPVAQIAKRLWFVPAAVMLVALAIDRTQSAWLYLTHFTIVSVCSGWLIALAKDGSLSAFRFLASDLAVWMGRRSYSLYLWHFPLVAGLSMIGLDGPIWGGAAFVASFLLADLSYRYIERPFVAMKSRFAPSTPRLRTAHSRVG